MLCKPETKKTTRFFQIIHNISNSYLVLTNHTQCAKLIPKIINPLSSHREENADVTRPGPGREGRLQS